MKLYVYVAGFTQVHYTKYRVLNRCSLTRKKYSLYVLFTKSKFKCQN